MPAHDRTSRVLGAVLAGGRARRFGADKAAARVNGVALIDLAAGTLARLVAAVVIVGRDHPGMCSLADLPGPGLGPLGGLAGALAHAAAHGYDAVLSTGCDIPELPGDLLARLSPGPACLAACPLVGLWPADLAPLLAAHLAQAEADRSLRGWAAKVAARAVDGPPPPNLNTPDEFAAYSIAASSASNGAVANVVRLSASA